MLKQNIKEKYNDQNNTLKDSVLNMISKDWLQNADYNLKTSIY